MGPDDRVARLALLCYLAVALYYGWSRDDPASIPVSILRGAFWPITLLMDWARQGYVPA